MPTSPKSWRMIREAGSERPPRGLPLRWIARAAAGFLAAALARAAPAADTQPASRTAGLAGRLAASVAAAQRVVEKVRGVPFRGPVASALLPEKDLPGILQRKIVEDLPAPFERYTESLAVLGLIEPSPGLKERITRLYVRQVAGFYDPAERKFYIVPERSAEATAGVPELGIDSADLMEEALLSHELTHALQDRRLGLDKRMKSLKESTDALLALQAFLEGEATVVMTETLLDRLPPESKALLSGNALAQMMSSLAAGGAAGIEGADGVPDFFVKELLFPYVSGTAWIQARRGSGPLARGWGAVDESYRHLPETTSEILHPEKSFTGRLRIADAAAPRLPAGTSLLYRDVLGEWVLKTLLERAGAEATAASIAAERQDDRILFFERGGAVGFVWKLRCASPAAARRLAGTLEPLYASRPAASRPSIRAEGDGVEVTAVPGPISPRGASTPSAGK